MDFGVEDLTGMEYLQLALCLWLNQNKISNRISTNLTELETVS